MKPIDLDGLFDEKLAVYMEENKGKYTERQWENLIPVLYKKFGDTYVSRIKSTPRQYYAAMSDEELAQTFAAHLSGHIPVPDFLCSELEGRNCTQLLLPLLSGGDEETVSYVINLIGADERAFPAYFAILTDENADGDVRETAAEKLKEKADAAKESALAFYRKGQAKEYMLEILARVTVRDEAVFGILLDAFAEGGEKLPLRAGYLASYGDDRALPYLMNKIEDRSIGFVEFQELKYAIEALGGEYDEPRDFTGDKDYLAIEDASSRERAGKIPRS